MERMCRQRIQRTLLNVPGKQFKVITEAQFFAQDTTTDVSKNEYVLFAGAGVYAQFVRRGTGSALQNGDTAMLLCRYIEYNIATDSIRSSNLYGSDAASPDVMSLQNNSGSLTGVFYFWHHAQILWHESSFWLASSTALSKIGTSAFC